MSEGEPEDEGFGRLAWKARQRRRPVVRGSAAKSGLWIEVRVDIAKSVREKPTELFPFR